ncbi:hypothetical protein PI124_g23849 [Phytophthora idaei]|nr:hypothetical protein PI124_g23849 [Phytophthora idaei]
MRLSVILLAVSALALLENGSALSASVDVDEGTMVSKMAPAEAELLRVGLSNGDKKRFLRNHDDEERLAGANMFNIKKLEEALNNAGYANTLFQRWKRHGVDEAKVSRKFKDMGISTDTNAQELAQSYRTWLSTHAANIDPKLFDKAMIYGTLEDVTRAKELFGKWKSYGLECDNVFKKFQTVGVRNDNDLYKVYLNYVAWLNTHYPFKETKLTSTQDFLFHPPRIKRAKSDSAFAEILFAKWNDSGLGELPVYNRLWKMGLGIDNAIYDMYKNYVFWLDKHFPLPAIATT